MFTDRVKVELKAGKGGNGVVAWHRAKYIPKGGPCGGNGGRGGSIIIQADVQIPSLDWFRNKRHIKAKNGGDGGPNCRQGKKGQNLILKVPCGTLLKSSETGALICDFTEDGQEIEICKGGKGGLGNDFFKSPTNRAPNYFTEGKPGEITKVELELKLIADVGLVGYPNAGKSTLISTLADVRVKAAAYPFTTLKPNLGFIEQEHGKRIFIADIPGIIEGAHRNKGLGIEFLRHIERTKLLLFVLDASGIDGRNPADDYLVLQDELKKYNDDLITRQSLIVLNKCDTEESKEHIKHFYHKIKPQKDTVFEISAICYLGTDQLMQAIKQLIGYSDGQR